MRRVGALMGESPGINTDVIAELERRGHKLLQLDRWATRTGRAQLIYKMNDGFLAATEPRTDGQAVGY